VDELEERSLRPIDDHDEPNDNGPSDYRPGDPDGVVIAEGETGGAWPPSFIHPSPWSGWPAEWSVPTWGPAENLVDTAWAALDRNSSVFASMPPYLVNAPAGLTVDWLDSPDPDIYSSWADFAHALMWDFLLGEVFVIATAHYSNGFPARFRIAPPWTVQVEWSGGRRRYMIGSIVLDPAHVLHIRYKSTVDDARGHGPLEVGRARLVAAAVLLRYLTNFVQGGAVPSSVIESDDDVTAEQATALHTQWINSRMSKLGLPAVLGGGLKWKATQANALDSALTELAGYTEAKIAILLSVPPSLLALPSGEDTMTYDNKQGIYDYHWRGHLRPLAHRLMLALSHWAVPLGVGIEVNRDEYVRPGPLERAQTWAIYLEHGVTSIEEVREAERFSFIPQTSPAVRAAAVVK